MSNAQQRRYAAQRLSRSLFAVDTVAFLAGASKTNAKERWSLTDTQGSAPMSSPRSLSAAFLMGKASLHAMLHRCWVSLKVPDGAAVGWSQTTDREADELPLPPGYAKPTDDGCVVLGEAGCCRSRLRCPYGIGTELGGAGGDTRTHPH